MKRGEDTDKAAFHERKMQDCKEAFKACYKAFRDDPRKKPLLHEIWSEYERHKARHKACMEKVYELPSRS